MTEHEMILARWRGVSGAARGVLTVRGTRGLLMVRATVLLLHRLKTSSISE